MNKRPAKIIVPLLVLSLSCTCVRLRSPSVYKSVQLGKTNDVAVGQDGTIHVLYSSEAQAAIGNDRHGVCHAYRAADGTWQSEFLESDEQPFAPVCVLAQGPDGVWHAFYN
jgi:hypothetical protein